MAISVEKLSIELQQLVVKNGKVDLAELQKVAEGKNEKLAAEAGELLRDELNGGKADGDIGDQVQLSSNAAENEPVEEEKPGFFKRAGGYIADWWTDKDKVSTDGKDDGYISAGEKVEAFGKGFAGGVVKNIIKNPIESVAIIGGTTVVAYGSTAALSALGVVAAGPIVAGVLIITGIGFGAYAIYQGIKGAKEADNDGAVKAGYEEAGTGASIVVMSGLGARKLGKSVTKQAEAAKLQSEAATSEAGAAEVKMQRPKQGMQTKDVHNFNTEKGVTPESVETRYTHKLGTDEAYCNRRTITGEEGAEVETFQFGENDVVKFSKIEYKYENGRRVECNKYTKDGNLAYTEKYSYDTKGQLTKVSQIDASHPEAGEQILNTFKWDENGYLLESTDVGLKKTYKFEYSDDGKLLKKSGIRPEDINVSRSALRMNPERQAILDRAGFTEDVIQRVMVDDAPHSGVSERMNMLRMVEYMEGRIAKGEKLSTEMLFEAQTKANGTWAHTGYYSEVEEEQLNLMLKYWNRADELKAAYRAEGRFVTRAQEVAVKAAQRKATLEQAGLTEDKIAQMSKEHFSYGDNQKEATLNLIEYLENRVAKGEKLTTYMVHDGIEACDGRYSQGGYGSLFQEEQLNLLLKYWNRADELTAAYREKGRFVTRAQEEAARSAQQ